jgi:hypothetical protein
MEKYPAVVKCDICREVHCIWRADCMAPWSPNLIPLEFFLWRHLEENI